MNYLDHDPLAQVLIRHFQLPAQLLSIDLYLSVGEGSPATGTTGGSLNCEWWSGRGRTIQITNSAAVLTDLLATLQWPVGQYPVNSLTLRLERFEPPCILIEVLPVLSPALVGTWLDRITIGETYGS